MAKDGLRRQRCCDGHSPRIRFPFVSGRKYLASFENAQIGTFGNAFLTEKAKSIFSIFSVLNLWQPHRESTRCWQIAGFDSVLLMPATSEGALSGRRLVLKVDQSGRGIDKIE
jgi:hypothetical protein